jgi:hypothetical protein
MERSGLGLGALALAALLGCGKSAGDTAIDEFNPGTSGTGGSVASASGGDDVSGGESGIVSGGGGSGGDSGGDEDSPRGCLEGELLPEDVVAAIERCIDPEEVVSDLEVLDGSSFVLQGSLCLEAWDSEGFDKSSLSTLHFRRVGDELELVSALPTSAAPIVQRSTLERTSVGFAATELIVCNETAYDWEDTYEVLTCEAPAVHLVFVPGTTPGELELVLAARLESEGATVVLGGKPDLVPPSLRSLDVPGEHLRAYERG